MNMIEITKPLAQSDSANLAENYSTYRPDYAPSVLDDILNRVGKPVSQLDFADVGAGTGMWTRMVAARGVRSAFAIEPDDAMRDQGRRHPDNGTIIWQAGSGEATGLPNSSIDLLTMASSFHRVDFDKAIEEVGRVLRPGGCFVALWNPRLMKVNALPIDITNNPGNSKNGSKRVSSVIPGITDALISQLEATGQFEFVTYFESSHRIEQSAEHYLSGWRSVNESQVKLGLPPCSEFLEWVEDRVANMTAIETTYLSCAWVARRSV